MRRNNEKTEPLYLWDSLLMRRYLASDGTQEGRDAFLMHYLPSLDPGLDARARCGARTLEDRIAERAHFFIATGQGLAAALRERYPQHPSYVCEPGVDAVFARSHRHEAEQFDDRITLLTVANLTRAKGYGEIAKIVRELTGRNWVWHIVGSLDADPGFTREFMRLASGLIESGRITFRGSLTCRPLARLMSRTDVFVSASHFESYGMALAEAVAAGVPVVATRVGEASRIVGEFEHARLVPAGAWEEFAAALTAMIDTRCRRSCPWSSRRRPPVRGWNEAFADFANACRSGIRNLDR